MLRIKPSLPWKCPPSSGLLPGGVLRLWGGGRDILNGIILAKHGFGWGWDPRLTFTNFSKYFVCQRTFPGEVFPSPASQHHSNMVETFESVNQLSVWISLIKIVKLLKLSSRHFLTSLASSSEVGRQWWRVRVRSPALTRCQNKI